MYHLKQEIKNVSNLTCWVCFYQCLSSFILGQILQYCTSISGGRKNGNLAKQSEENEMFCLILETCWAWHSAYTKIYAELIYSSASCQCIMLWNNCQQHAIFKTSKLLSSFLSFNTKRGQSILSWCANHCMYAWREISISHFTILYSNQPILFLNRIIRMS